MSMLRSVRARSMIVELRERWRHLLPDPILRRLPPDRRRFLEFELLERSATLMQSAGCQVLYSATARPLTHRQPLGGYPQRWSLMEAIAPRPARATVHALTVFHRACGMNPACVAARQRMLSWVPNLNAI